MLPRLLAAGAILIAVALYFWPAPSGGAPLVQHAAAVATLTIGLMATAVVPEFLSILVFFFLAIVLSVAKPGVVFSGFHSGAVWLVFGGLIIGAAIEDTGLGARFAGSLERWFASSYPRVIVGSVVMMSLLAFIMPSSVGRVTIMLPIVLALADRLGFKRDSNGRAGMTLAVALGTLNPTFAILPASVPNLALVGAAEAIYGIHITYSEYFLLQFPVIGVVSILALPAFIILLFPARIEHGPVSPTPQPPFTPEQRRLIAILLGALLLWATDSLHGISPSWVALGAAIVIMLPRIGVAPPERVLPKLNFGPMLVVAGLIGLGAMVTQTGLGKAIGNTLLAGTAMSPGGGFRDFAGLIGLGVVMCWFTTLPGLPAIMTTFADTLAAATGLPIATVLMAQVPSWALLMFPYQVPPLIATKAISGLPVGRFLRLLLPMAAFGWLVIVPLEYVWWRILGYLP